MVTTTTVSAIQSTSYYEKDDYYSRTITNEDFWFGNGLNSPLSEGITNTTNSIEAPLLHQEYLSKVNGLIKIKIRIPTN